MQIDKESIVELAEAVSVAVVKALEDRQLVGKAAPERVRKEKRTAYKKTEQLLYNYRGFKKIVAERLQEIEDIKVFGVPRSSNPFGERVSGGQLPSGIVLPEESVETAVNRIYDSIKETIAVIRMIDKCLDMLKADQYYQVLEMIYFEGRTQEDVALEFDRTQVTISYHKSRLIRELSVQLFPDQTLSDIMN